MPHLSRYILALASTVAPFGASATCSFATAQPIMCSTGTAAVKAFLHYGTDTAAVQTGHARDFLRSAGCGSPFDRGKATHHIEQLSKGKVALPDSYQPVLLLQVDGQYNGYVHAKYVKGTCDAYEAPTIQGARTDQ